MRSHRQPYSRQVAVSNNGDVFVADGYCNSRIMHFSPTGSFIQQITLPKVRRFESGILRRATWHPYPPSVSNSGTLQHCIAVTPSRQFLRATTTLPTSLGPESDTYVSLHPRGGCGCRTPSRWTRARMRCTSRTAILQPCAAFTSLATLQVRLGRRLPSSDVSCEPLSPPPMTRCTTRHRPDRARSWALTCSPFKMETPCIVSDWIQACRLAGELTRSGDLDTFGPVLSATAAKIHSRWPRPQVFSISCAGELTRSWDLDTFGPVYALTAGPYGSLLALTWDKASQSATILHLDTAGDDETAGAQQSSVSLNSTQPGAVSARLRAPATAGIEGCRVVSGC